MKTNVKDKVTAIGFTAVLAAVLILNIALPDKDVSTAERRKLDKLPKLTTESLLEGNYFEDLEDYALDQFVLRDPLRTVKSAVRLGLFMQLENNDLFIRDGGIFKLAPQVNVSAVQTNCSKLMNTAASVWPDAKLYYSIVPEKNTFLDSALYPAFDSELYNSAVAQSLSGAQNINIDDLLGIEDYYLTDPHWKQEQIIDVADRLLTVMGSTANDENFLTINNVAEFHGTYQGQLPLALEKDVLCSVTSSLTDNASVFNYETGKTGGVYAYDKLTAMDPYDFYLYGACALLRIDNPSGTPGKELVIFRDSFGSSVAPLMLSDYQTVTLVDLRYVSSQVLGQYVTPAENTDVLFLFSQTILNNNGVFR